MTSGWIGPGDAAWQAYLEEAPHDFYHLPGYVALTAEQTGAEPVAFFAHAGDASLFIPLHLRSLPSELGASNELKDALSPYGYPAPLLTAPEADRAERCSELMTMFVAAARTTGIVTVFLRLHPLLTLPEQAMRSVGKLVEHGPTVLIDLARPKERLWSETRRDHRLAIRRLEREGFEARFDRWEGFDDFIGIYRCTMEHVKATEDYFFDRRYFEGLRSALGERLHLCTVHAPDGRVAAAGLFPAIDGLVQNHLTGTHPSFREQAPSKFLLHSVRLWAAQQGYRWFHLGGGLGGNEDSLFAFKAGFARERAMFQSVRIVIDPEQNAALIRAWTTCVGRQPDQSAGGYFPAYRSTRFLSSLSR